MCIRTTKALGKAFQISVLRPYENLFDELNTLPQGEKPAQRAPTKHYRLMPTIHSPDTARAALRRKQSEKRYLAHGLAQTHSHTFVRQEPIAKSVEDATEGVKHDDRHQHYEDLGEK